ncbi:MAG: hypothetical protein R2751_15640 [Bacteroidales bacterium]
MKKLISWVEIPAKDIHRAAGFYGRVLDIELEVEDYGTEQMACFPSGEGPSPVPRILRRAQAERWSASMLAGI